ncbi:MAG: 50S ribosomal protein L9 [Nitrospinae bacterium]|nr:50S ribosomal protein L9 [Nitrospinota bacterium]
MKVILKDFVKSLGNPGDEVKVADGYARNFLIPKKLAEAATAGNKKTFQTNLKQRARKLAKAVTEADGQKAALEALEPIVFIRKAGADGKLFGSVTGGDVEEALKERGITVDRKKMVIDRPIRHLGDEEVALWLHPKVTAKIKITVQAEVVEEPSHEGAEEQAKDEAAAETSNEE